MIARLCCLTVCPSRLPGILPPWHLPCWQVLLKIWLGGRTVQQTVAPSGFQLSLVLIYLLDSRQISMQMGSYHMLRVALRFLSTADWSSLR